MKVMGEREDSGGIRIVFCLRLAVSKNGREGAAPVRAGGTMLRY